MENEKDHWSIDKRLPIATLVVLMLQSLAVVWWAASLDNRVATLTIEMDDIKLHGSPPLRERLAAIEADRTSYKNDVGRIELRLKYLDEKMDLIIQRRIK